MDFYHIIGSFYMCIFVNLFFMVAAYNCIVFLSMFLLLSEYIGYFYLSFEIMDNYGLREACGVFGCVARDNMTAEQDVASIIQLGLVGLQHRLICDYHLWSMW